MTIEQYCQSRMVILKPSATAYEAVRAMEENHVGMILVQSEQRLLGVLTDRDVALRVTGGELDPSTTAVGDVMTQTVWSLPSNAALTQVVQTMRDHYVRRVPIVEDEHVIGLVTLDDLLVSKDCDRDSVAAIVRAQLAQPAAHKPAGPIHPTRGTGAPAISSAERHAARAARAASSAAQLARDATGVDEPERAMAALELVATHIARRLSAGEAKDMASQLPSALRERMLDMRAGPDRSITRARVEQELSQLLGVDSRRAAELTDKLGAALCTLLSPGEIAQVRGQLPEDLRSILPQPSTGQARGEMHS